MTTRPARFAPLLLLFASCGGEARARRPDGLDVSAYPDDMREAYAVFEYRCSRCHSLARPLNAEIEGVAFWDDYVERMRRQPGSGINHADARTILRFLTYYTEHRGGEGGGGARPVRRFARRGAP